MEQLKHFNHNNKDEDISLTINKANTAILYVNGGRGSYAPSDFLCT